MRANTVMTVMVLLCQALSACAEEADFPLDEQVSFSEVIVTGAVSEVRPIGETGSYSYAIAAIRVDEILKGDPKTVPACIFVLCAMRPSNAFECPEPIYLEQVSGGKMVFLLKRLDPRIEGDSGTIEMVVKKLARRSPPEKLTAEEAETLVRQLGDVAFKARQAAQERLNRGGETHMPLLRKRLAGTSDLEIKTRLQAILAELEWTTVKPEDVYVFALDSQQLIHAATKEKVDRVRELAAEQDEKAKPDALQGKRFQSVRKQEMGLGPTGPVLGFSSICFLDGKFSWSYSDVVETGSYQYDAATGKIAGASGDRKYDGKYDPKTGVLIWSGEEYKDKEVRQEK